MTLTPPKFGRKLLEVHGELADEIVVAGKIMGITLQAVLREVVPNFETGIAVR